MLTVTLLIKQVHKGCIIKFITREIVLIKGSVSNSLPLKPYIRLQLILKNQEMAKENDFQTFILLHQFLDCTMPCFVGSIIFMPLTSHVRMPSIYLHGISSKILPGKRPDSIACKQCIIIKSIMKDNTEFIAKHSILVFKKIHYTYITERTI